MVHSAQGRSRRAPGVQGGGDQQQHRRAQALAQRPLLEEILRCRRQGRHLGQQQAGEGKERAVGRVNGVRGRRGQQQRSLVLVCPSPAARHRWVSRCWPHLRHDGRPHACRHGVQLVRDKGERVLLPGPASRSCTRRHRLGGEATACAWRPVDVLRLSPGVVPRGTGHRRGAVRLEAKRTVWCHRSAPCRSRLWGRQGSRLAGPSSSPGASHPACCPVVERVPTRAGQGKLSARVPRKHSLNVSRYPGLHTSLARGRGKTHRAHTQAAWLTEAASLGALGAAGVMETAAGGEAATVAVAPAARPRRTRTSRGCPPPSSAALCSRCALRREKWRALHKGWGKG